MNITNFVQSSYARWNKHDVAALMAEFVEGGLDIRPDHPQGITGEAYGDFLRSVFTWSSDFAVEMVSLHEVNDGKGYVTEWEIRGANDGPGADGSPATGKTYKLGGITICEVEGDKIRQARVYFDLLALGQQLAPTK